MKRKEQKNKEKQKKEAKNWKETEQDKLALMVDNILRRI